MTQGRANSNKSAGTQPMPKPKAIDPGRTDQIGQSVAFVKGPLYIGRGFGSPKPHSTSHPKGSQGKH